MLRSHDTIVTASSLTPFLLACVIHPVVQQETLVPTLYLAPQSTSIGYGRALLTMATRSPDQNIWLRRFLALYVLCTLGSAVVGSNPFHPDEHFQILEFASYKLGATPAELLPWEYRFGMRPWLLPSIAFAVRWIVRDPFGSALVLRLLAAFLHLASLRQLWLVRARLQIEPTAKLAFFVLLMSFGPYLGSRFSSEGVSASFSCLGLLYMAAAPDRRRLFVAGLCFAAAFEARFQSALMITAGWLHWHLSSAWDAPHAHLSRKLMQRLRVSLPSVGGTIVGLGLLACLNAWGYGRWTFPAWAYVRENVLHGVAAKFSTEPWYAYAFLPLTNVCAPAAALTLAGTLVFWWRHPKHLLTWLTLPSFVLFSILGHKEERFLFPLVLPATIAAAATWIDVSEILKARGFKGLARIAGFTMTFVNVATMVFLAVYPLQWREHVPVAEAIYRQTQSGTELYTEDAYTPAFPSFRKDWVERRVTASCLVPKGALLLTSHEDTENEVIYSEWLPASVRTISRTLVRKADALFPGRMQTPTWYRLVRVTKTRNPESEETCPVVPFKPIATEAPR
jgi:GPI mannosyltransferase 3